MRHELHRHRRAGLRAAGRRAPAHEFLHGPAGHGHSPITSPRAGTTSSCCSASRRPMPANGAPSASNPSPPPPICAPSSRRWRQKRWTQSFTRRRSAIFRLGGFSRRMRRTNWLKSNRRKKSPRGRGNCSWNCCRRRKSSRNCAAGFRGRKSSAGNSRRTASARTPSPPRAGNWRSVRPICAW